MKNFYVQYLKISKDGNRPTILTTSERIRIENVDKFDASIPESCIGYQISFYGETSTLFSEYSVYKAVDILTISEAAKRYKEYSVLIGLKKMNVEELKRHFLKKNVDLKEVFCKFVEQSRNFDYNTTCDKSKLPIPQGMVLIDNNNTALIYVNDVVILEDN